jgi:hypothetical protein
VREGIAIVGGFATGKSTLAEMLVTKYGYTRVSFAGRLKQVAADVYNGGVPLDKNMVYGTTDMNGVHQPLSGRQVLQRLGQSVKELDRDFWIKWMLADIDAGKYEYGPYVIDDCRFPYEAEALRDRGFLIAKIELDLVTRMHRYEALYGRLPNADELLHPSETEVEKIVPDVTLDGTLSPEVLADVLILA